jgi:chlorophyll synthase
MAVPQAVVVALLLLWDKPLHALAVLVMLGGQLAAMRVLLRDPEGKTPWYQGVGILLYISGMMVAAFALRGL